MKIEATSAVWAQAFKAVTPHSGTSKDCPDILQSVRIELDETGAYLVATDRYTLIMWKLVTTDTAGEGSVVLALADAQRIAKVAAGMPRHLANYSLTLTVEDSRASFTALDTTVLCQGLEPSAFPPFRRLIADAVGKLDEYAHNRASDVGLNPAFLAKWVKATDRNGPVSLHLTGDQRLIVVAGECFVGLQMPVRRDSLALPSWAPGLTVPTPEAVAS